MVRDPGLHGAIGPARNYRDEIAPSSIRHRGGATSNEEASGERSAYVRRERAMGNLVII